MARARRRLGVESDPTVPEGTLGHLEEGAERDARRVGAKARSASVWTWAVPAIVFVVVMLIFILQNFQGVEVSFISLHGKFPLALCLLFAAILGALTIAFAELARAVQLRRRTRREKPQL
jgi:uncharacterized integral membrane protein